MHRNMIVAACAALALAGVPAAAGAQSQSPASATAGSSKTTSQPATATHGSGQAMSHTDALAALQDARETLARLTEASMSQDARDALAKVSDDFRALYKGYTGEEPAPKKSATEAAQSTAKPSGDWEKSYDTLSASIDRIIGKEGAGQSGTVGTSGTTGAAKTYELTTPVRQDFEVLRQELQRFHDAAGGRTSTGAAK